MAQKTNPRFINPNNFNVHVLDEKKQNIVVSPYRRKDDKLVGATFVVEGPHYANQVHPFGSLAPFPAGVADAVEVAATPAKVGAEDGKGTDVAPDGAGTDADTDDEGGTEDTGATEDDTGDEDAGTTPGDNEGGTGDEVTYEQVMAELESLTNKQLPDHVLHSYGVELPSGCKSKKARVAHTLEMLFGDTPDDGASDEADDN